MEINRNNYQEYAAEWLEGSLSTELKEAFERFLNICPDIADELYEMRDMEGLQPYGFFDEKADFSGLKHFVSDKELNNKNFLEFVMAQIDGELPDSAVIKLENWLKENPEKRKEAEIFSLTILTPDTGVVFKDVESLRQPVIIIGEAIDENMIDELVIASIEGELSEEDQQKLNKYIEGNRSAEVLYRQYASTKLNPDTGIICPGKASLKQKAVVPLFTAKGVLRITAVAASIALLAGIFLIDRTEELSVTSPEETTLVQIPGNARPDHVLIAKADELVTGQEVKLRTERKVNKTATLTDSGDESPAIKTAGPELASVPEVVPITQSLRKAVSINPVLSEYVSPAVPRVNLPVAYAYTQYPEPSGRKLTISEFPIEQIRYFTGGGNQRPGLLADLSIPKLMEITNTHGFINSAGQQLITMWVQWKEKALDEVVPYR